MNPAHPFALHHGFPQRSPQPLPTIPVATAPSATSQASTYPTPPSRSPASDGNQHPTPPRHQRPYKPSTRRTRRPGLPRRAFTRSPEAFTTAPRRSRYPVTPARPAAKGAAKPSPGGAAAPEGTAPLQHRQPRTAHRPRPTRPNTPKPLTLSQPTTTLADHPGPPRLADSSTHTQPSPLSIRQRTHVVPSHDIVGGRHTDSNPPISTVWGPRKGPKTDRPPSRTPAISGLISYGYILPAPLHSCDAKPADPR